jgi:hypothetical protein
VRQHDVRASSKKSGDFLAFELFSELAPFAIGGLERSSES